MLPASVPLAFDYKDPKEISAVSLTLDSPLEPIVGYAKGISGTVFFDPLHPERSTGRLAVDVSSVQFANDGYSATAQGYALNGKRWPQLLLAIRRVESVRKVSATRYTGIVLADFTCRGVVQPKRLVVTADLFPGKADERTNGRVRGDLLVLRTRFSVSRKAHGISEGIPDSMVGDVIEVGVAVVGIHTTAAPPPPKAVAAVPPAEAARVPEARWEVELAGRDDPRLLQVERTGDRLTFRDAEGAVGATRLGATGFRLDSNPTYGEATGELDETGNGFVRTREGTIALRGRRVEAFRVRAAATPKGKGFAPLDLPRRMREQGTAGVAVVRLRGDAPPEIGTYGVLRSGDDAPVSEATTFQAGTMSTPVLHLAALRLAASGRLDLDRSVDDLLGKGTIPEGPQGWGSRVTVLDLLRGTAGFPFSKSAGYAPGTPEEVVAIGAPEGEPGKEEHVSAANEALLERVVAKAGGATAPEVVAREVFAPLGMRDSAYGPPPEGAARGHYSAGEPTLAPYHLYADALGNGLWTSPRDFGRFLSEVERLLGGRPNLLLKDRSFLERVESPKSVLGIRKGDDGSLYLGGDPYGFFCEFFMRPEKRETILVMQNRMMAWRLANDVRDALRKDAVSPPTPRTLPLPRIGGGSPATLDALQGRSNLVVFFLNEQCGVTHAYRGRLQRLFKDFDGKGFAFVGVRTGRKQFPNKPVDLPEVASLRIPFYDDADGALMRAYGVGQSLTFAVFDPQGRLRYQGGVDDSVDPAGVKRTPLRDALRSLATGRPVRVVRTPTYGCAILPVER